MEHVRENDQQLIEEGRIISEYLGCMQRTLPPHWGGGVSWFSPTSSDGKTRTFFYSEGDEEYHTSWDWLMPVVTKCLTSLRDGVHMNVIASYWERKFARAFNELTIESMYNTTVAFIKATRG